MNRKFVGELLAVLLIFVLLILFSVKIVNAYEFAITKYGLKTATMTLAADSSSCGLRLWNYSDTTTIQLQGSHLNIRYRTRTDSVFTAAEDSIIVSFLFTPLVGHSESDTLLTGFYQTKTIAVAAPSLNWTYGAVGYNLDTSATFNSIMKIFLYAVDSIPLVVADSTKAGRHYHKYFEYYIEEWK